MSESTNVDVEASAAASLNAAAGSVPDGDALAGPVPAVYVALPEGLEEMAPGPELGAALAMVDRGACNGYQLVVVLQARHRLMCWLQAEMLSDTQDLGYVYGGSHPFGPRVRKTQRDPHLEEEVAFALSWTAGVAETYVGLAYGSLIMYPAVHAALLAGHIDLPKVRVLLDEVELLDNAEAATVIAQVLPDADTETTGKLKARLQRLVMKIDPDAVRKRHQKALDDRDVRCVRHRDGTASIIGRNLPADKATAAMDHLSRIATATKKAGDPNGTRFDDLDRRRTSQIRADVFLDLLDGADPTIPANQGGAGALHPAPRKGVINLTVDLTTLMNLTEHPGELAGFGPVVADIARQATEQFSQRATWRFSLTHDGRLIHEGRLHYRPTAEQKAYVQARDRECQAPICRRPAHQSDIDHITAWEHRGTTIEDNMCVVCKRHHRAKHGGFRLYRSDFGLLWISPRGRTYPVTLGRELDQTQRRMLQDLINQGEERNLKP